MTRSIVDLPIEVLRRIIQDLLYNPVEPTRFRKSNLLPLASTCRHLRDASIEFLFWSVDLFEASFGLQHRVVKSNVALERFHNLVAYPVGYLRGGVRRFLVRDRDRTASIDLWRVLEKFESLRSLHLDGPFGPETFPLAPQSLLEYPENIRLYTTLVNLTFIACKASSPLFPFFLQSGVFVNLTRLYYQDDNEEMGGWTTPRSKSQRLPSPFAQLVSETKPVFPYLSTIVIKVAPIPNDRLRHILHFLEIHSASLQRLSAYMGVAPGSIYFMRFTFSNTPDYEHKESTALLWETVERLSSLRVLSVDVACALTGCAPKSVIHLPQLQGVYLHTHSIVISPQWHDVDRMDPIIGFFDKFQAPHIAFGQDLSYVSEVEASLKAKGWTDTRDAYRRARTWFEESALRFARTLTHIGASSGLTVFVVLEGGGREIGEASPAKKDEILQLVGGWSFEEFEM